MARSMIARQNIKLNLVPGGVPPVLNVSQYDSAYDVHFTIYNGAQLFEIPDDVSIQFQETKRDRNGFTVGATKSAQTGQCYIWMQEQMSAVPGDQICELVLTNTTEDQIGTANFIMRVEPAALNKNTVISESEIAYANQVLAKLGSVAAYKAQLDAQGNEIDQLNTNLAAEVAARQAADNTLQSNINSEASARATADASLQSQINQLVAPEGAAPSAAEIENARVGADGTVYPTLGDAIRGQVTDVKNAMSSLVITPDLRNGTIGNGGNVNAIATRYVVPVSAALSIVKLIKTVTDAVSYKFGVYTFDATVAGMTSSAANISGHSIRRNASYYEGANDNFSITFSDEEKFFVFDALAYDTNGDAVPLRIANLQYALAVTWGISSTYAKGLVDAEKSRTDTIFAEQMDAIKLDANAYDFGFVLGTLNPGSSSAPGTEGNGNTRIRSTYIRCGKGSIVTVSAPRQNLLIVYEYDRNRNYISDSAWTDGNRYVVNHDGYIRILIRYSTSNDIITDAYKAELEGYLTLARYIPQSIAEEDEVNIVDIESEYVHKYSDYARHQRGSIGTPLTLLHFSDLHSDISALNRIAADADNLGAQIDGKICTGDMVANTAVQIASWWDTSVMTCIGNHETASYDASTGYNWTALSMADRDAYYIAPFESGWGITHTAGTSYYYKDYSTQKVRLIVMDAMLYSGTPGAEATAQTAWLVDLLSDAITNGYHVLIAIHAPHGGATAKVCSFSRYGQGAMPTYADCNTPQSVIDAVSEAITNGLHFIGYLVGHTHQDNIWNAEGDGKQLMYCITCAAVAQVAQWNKSDQHRDTENDAFNIVTIDTTNTLVKIVRGGGADIDDHMRTRKAICFDYSTGEVVGEVL